MARISGVNIPTGKKINIALTYIFGIGPKIAGDICSEASIDLSKRIKTFAGTSPIPDPGGIFLAKPLLVNKSKDNKILNINNFNFIN